MENITTPKAMYPYTYGDTLTQTEANKRLIKHGLAVFIFLELETFRKNLYDLNQIIN